VLTLGWRKAGSRPVPQIKKNNGIIVYNVRSWRRQFDEFYNPIIMRDLLKQ
jgi:hypothetical protein